LFKIFTFNIVKGKTSDPLPGNSSIAISKKIALKYFGKTDVLGESFHVQNKYDLKIAAVYEDMPSHSTLIFDFVIPFQIWRNEDPSRENWDCYEPLTYASENTIGQLALSFTIIAVLISCLGLFGLSSFTAERRMKELGIRKVFGATVAIPCCLSC
jgi:ABC-type antimicrobial peptide transport system permease subunit